MNFTGFGLIHPCQILANSWGRCFLAFFVGQRCDKRWHMIPRSHGLLGKLSYLSPTAKNLGCFYVDEGVYWKTRKKSLGDVSNISRLVAPPDNLGWRNPPIICNEFGSCTSLLGSKNESSGTFRWFSIRVCFVGFRRFRAMKLLKGDANKFLSSWPERNDEKYPKWFLNSFDALTKNWAVLKTNDYFLYTRGQIC